MPKTSKTVVRRDTQTGQFAFRTGARVKGGAVEDRVGAFYKKISKRDATVAAKEAGILTRDGRLSAFYK